MQYIHSIKIKNFKTFGEEIKIDFDDTTVLIGSNNVGKTTVIQALALWQLGIATFVSQKFILKNGELAQKGKLTVKTGIGINRQDIAQVPNTNARQLFYKGNIRKGTEHEYITIAVAIRYQHEIKECTVLFKYFKSELIYCYLGNELVENAQLLLAAAEIKVNLLYPMSGLEREETVLQEGAIKKQIGRGITAGLLRNICYNLHTNAPDDWKNLVRLMKKLFYIEIQEPRRLATDDLVLEYNFDNKSLQTETPLDILQAGRGQLQMLLLLAFTLWREKSIIMIDEPDAHLEVLRQSQVLEVLKKIADEKQSQIIIATHSEVIMNDTDKLTFLLNGKQVSVNNSKDALKKALRDFGVEHYYKAQITKSILYLEGTTDKSNLIAIAEKLQHAAKNILEDKIFVYYTQSPDEQHLEHEEFAQGYYEPHKKHFFALQPVVTELTGLAILDSDGQNRTDAQNSNLTTLFWKKYELENYFITPESVRKYVEKYLEMNKNALFFVSLQEKLLQFDPIFTTYFLQPVFGDVLEVYQNLTDKKGRTALYNQAIRDKKVSKLLEDVFENAQTVFGKILLRKGEFYKIAAFCEVNDIDAEVKEKLDKIVEMICS